MWSPTATPDPAPRSLLATTLGPEVALHPRGTARGVGRVAAVFPSSFYVSLTCGLVCITRADVDLGPFSVVTTAPRNADFRDFRLEADQIACVDDRRILIRGRLDVDLGSARRWTPECLRGRPDPMRVARGLAHLRRRLPPEMIGMGLGGVLKEEYCVDADDPVGLAAGAPVLAARAFAAAALSGRRSPGIWARRLIGLGPGMTPSGDDFLGGFLIALHAVGCGNAARHLWSEIRDEAHASTNSISYALLSAAAKGNGSAGLHAVLARILCGAEPGSALTRLTRQGHSSGWDTLAGVAVVLGSVSRCDTNRTAGAA